jgi:hypothetical protein
MREVGDRDWRFEGLGNAEVGRRGPCEVSNGRLRLLHPPNHPQSMSKSRLSTRFPCLSCLYEGSIAASHCLDAASPG